MILGGIMMKVYEMEMEFELFVGLKEINDFMELMGFEEKTGVPGCTLIVSQTLPFIPNEEYLRKVEGIIRDHYGNEKVEVLDCKFKGYKKFLEKEIKE